MNAVMTVDLSELDAWSAQVQRASDDLTGIARNGGSALVQTDFGPILETMMGAYNSLLPSVHQSLEDNGTGMRDHAEALRATARDFTLTEDGVVRRHNAKGIDGRDGSSSFFDVADTTIRRVCVCVCVRYATGAATLIGAPPSRLNRAALFAARPAITFRFWPCSGIPEHPVFSYDSTKSRANSANPVPPVS